MAKEFVPQPFEVLKAQFKQAVQDRHSVTAILEDKTLRPANQSEKHIFDFDDGIRLIVSRDYLDAIELIHFSASIDQRYYKHKGKNLMQLMDIMEEHFCSISGYKKEQVNFIKFSEGSMVPHWYVPFQILN